MTAPPPPPVIVSALPVAVDVPPPAFIQAVMGF